LLLATRHREHPTDAVILSEDRRAAVVEGTAVAVALAFAHHPDRSMPGASMHEDGRSPVSISKPGKARI